MVDVSVRLGREDGLGTDRLIHWCGAQLQPPPRAVSTLDLPESRVQLIPWGGGGLPGSLGLRWPAWVAGAVLAGGVLNSARWRWQAEGGSSSGSAPACWAVWAPARLNC